MAQVPDTSPPGIVVAAAATGTGTENDATIKTRTVARVSKKPVLDMFNS
jgi:hypothetical protein